MNLANRTLLLTAAVIGGIGFTDRVAENATLGVTVAATAVEPTLQVSKLRDEILLQGHTISAAQEHELLNVAATTFPGMMITAEFEPLGIVPTHWENSANQALGALAAVESGTAVLTSDQVAFRVVSTSDDRWESRLHQVRSRLPEAVSIREHSISVGTEDVAGLCRSALAGFSVGAINFEEATATLRPSAYPRLDQLVSIADACRDASVKVTGHTDSSGAETWNQTLSMRRAEAVASYLASNGIAADRLQPVGAGSSDPVATNESRWGRSLNRRIEIEFLTD